MSYSINLKFRRSIFVILILIVIHFVYFVLDYNSIFVLMLKKVDSILIFIYSICVFKYLKINLFHPICVFIIFIFYFYQVGVLFDVLLWYKNIDFFSYSIYSYRIFDTKTQNLALDCIVFSQLFFLLGGLCAMFLTKKIYLFRIDNIALVRKISLYCFLISYIPYAYSVYLIVKYGMDNGYTSFYSGTVYITQNENILIRLSDDLFFAGFFMYISTYPKWKEMRTYLIMFLVLSSMLLFSGQRINVISLYISIFTYFVFRGFNLNKNNAIKIFFSMFSLYAILKLVSLYRSFYYVDFVEYIEVVDVFSLIGFDYGSSNIIKEVIWLKEYFKEGYSYILHPIFDVFKNGNLDLNTMIHDTSSLALKLSYLIDKDRFYNGEGFGSSLIAELYLLGDVYAVMIGPFLYTFIFVYIINKYKYSFHICFILLFIMPSFFFAGRYEYFGFIPKIIRPIVYICVADVIIKMVFIYKSKLK